MLIKVLITLISIFIWIIISKNSNINNEVFNMDDNKKLICAAAGAIGALAAVSATVFAVKQHKKKQMILMKCLKTNK